MTATYVPILKWKLGEQTALSHLTPADRALAIPLIEILDESVDGEDATSDPAQNAYTKIVGQMRRSWGTAPVFVDLGLVDIGTQAPGGGHPVAFFFQLARAAGLSAVPVTGVGRDAAFQQAVAGVIAADRRGACLRVDVDDLIDANFGTAVPALLERIGCNPAEIDLLLDWGAIGELDGPRTFATMRALVPNVPFLAAWRSVIVAASSFPQTLAAAGVGRSTILRAEWDVYQRHVQNVATGDVGSHFQRHHRYPGTHPLAARRFFAFPAAARGARWLSVSALRGADLLGDGGYAAQVCAFRKPFSSTKCSARSVSRSAMT